MVKHAVRWVSHASARHALPLHSNTIIWHNFLCANFSGLYARLQMDDKVRMSTPGVPSRSIQEANVEHGLHLSVSGCSGSCFTCGRWSPGTQSFRDCVRDHSGALSSRDVIPPKCCCFRFCLRHSYSWTWHTLEPLSDLPMPCFSTVILFIDPLNWS